MYYSTITIKGQTTIPRDIREYLHLTPQDKIVFIPEKEGVVMKLLKGNILVIKGALRDKSKGKIDFHQLREKVKENIVKRIKK